MVMMAVLVMINITDTDATLDQITAGNGAKSGNA
jgi:hypothetical protein